MEVVNKIIKNCKNKYGDRFQYYLTGSFARNEINFKDYDIAIYDNNNDKKDWIDLLENFYNKKELDGKNIDAQIDQMTHKIKTMQGNVLNKKKNNLVKRYVYSKNNLDSSKFVKYKNINGNLWEKELVLVKQKHRDMGLDKIKRIYMEL